MRRWWVSAAAVVVGLMALPVGAQAAQLDGGGATAQIGRPAVNHDYSVTIQYDGSISSGWIGCNGSDETAMPNTTTSYWINHFGSCEMHYQWHFTSQRFELVALAHSAELRPEVSDPAWDAAEGYGTYTADIQSNCIDTYPLAGDGPRPGGDYCQQIPKPWTGTTTPQLYRPWVGDGGRPLVTKADNGFDLYLASPLQTSAIDYDPANFTPPTGPASAPSKSASTTAWYAPIWDVIGQGFGCVFNYRKLDASWQKFFGPELKPRVGQPSTMTQTIHQTYFQRFPPSGNCDSNGLSYTLVGQPQSASMLLNSTVRVTMKPIR